MVSSAYDLLYKAHRAAKVSQERRRKSESTSGISSTPSASSDSAGPTSNRTRRSTTKRARVLNDTTLTVTGSAVEVFELSLCAAKRLGEVSHAESDDGMIAVVAEFLHTAPCSLSLQVTPRGRDRAHVRCHVEPLSPGETPPVAAVTRLVAQTIEEVQVRAAS